MTDIDYDLEFLEDGHTIEIISIALVADDGREYYAVNSDAPWERIREHSWLMENVWPHLPLVGHQSGLKYVGGGEHKVGLTSPGTLDRRDSRVKPRWVIANEVRDFIQAAGPDQVKLWADYGAYDHVALCQLWGTMMHLPPGVPMWTHDLQQEIERLQTAPEDLPQQTEGAHDALADARHNQTIRRWLAEQAKRAKL